MSASIRSTLRNPPAGPVVGPVQVDVSRDDLRKGYQVNLDSVNVQTTYAWALAFTPDSPDGTASSAALTSAITQTTSFIVDNEGSYLIRLVVDAGLPTEDTAFLRFRYATKFGGIKLVAAGERRDGTGIVPSDADPTGWTDNQNQNLQVLLSQIRRHATTGRTLYVEANRGRDASNTQNDPTVTYSVPGSDTAATVDDVSYAAEGHGDFSTVNEAITYAGAAAARGEPVLSATNPYFIFIKPGLYVEDLNLQPWIYLIGGSAGTSINLTGLASDVIIRTANSGGGTHEYSPTNATDTCGLFNLTLDNIAATAEGVVKQTAGILAFNNCHLWQQGTDALQGPAFDGASAGVSFLLLANNTEFRSEATADNDRSVINLGGVSSTGTLKGCLISGRTGIYLNRSKGTGSYCQLENTAIAVTDGYGIRANAQNLNILHSSIASTNDNLNIVIDDFGGAAGVDNFTVRVEHSEIQQIVYDSAATAGTTSLNTGANTILGTAGTPVVLTSGALTSYTANVSGRSLGYVSDWEDPTNVGVDVVPAAAQLGKANLQDAVDLLANLSNPQASAFGFTLQAAYDGVAAYNPFTIGAGLGRVIDATSGALQITGAPTLWGPINTSLDGGIQTTGPIDIGPIVGTGLGSELFLDPNHYGVGPHAKFGNAVWPANRKATQLAVPAGVISAGYNAANGGPYSLRMMPYSISLSGTGELGRVILTGGHVPDTLAGAGTTDASSLYFEGGHVGETAGSSDGGFVVIAPGGTANGGSDGRVRIVDPTGSTPGILTGAGAIVDPVGVTGVLYLAVPNKAWQIDIPAVTTAAALPALITLATDGVIQGGTGGGGELTLTTTALGPNADLIYVGDSTAGTLNTALGDLATGTWTVGTNTRYVDAYCSAHGVLTVVGSIISSGTISSYTAIDSTDNTYLALSSDSLIGVNTSIGVINVLITLDSTLPAGTEYKIKDEGGNAGTNNIVITPSAGTIDGAASLTINTNDGSAPVYFNGTNWFIY